MRQKWCGKYPGWPIRSKSELEWRSRKTTNQVKEPQNAYPSMHVVPAFPNQNGWLIEISLDNLKLPSPPSPRLKLGFWIGAKMLRCFIEGTGGYLQLEIENKAMQTLDRKIWVGYDYVPAHTKLGKKLNKQRRRRRRRGCVMAQFDWLLH